MGDPPTDEIVVTNQEDSELNSDVSTTTGDNNSGEDSPGDETVTENAENSDTSNQNDDETHYDFYPARLLAIMTIGVLSNDIEAVLGFVEDNPHGENAKIVPRRQQIRDDAVLEIAESIILGLPPALKTRH